LNYEMRVIARNPVPPNQRDGVKPVLNTVK